MVVSLSGSPPTEFGEKFPVTPVRAPSRPVSIEPRLGVHTLAAAWKSVRRMPRARSASSRGVSRTSPPVLKP